MIFFVIQSRKMFDELNQFLKNVDLSNLNPELLQQISGLQGGIDNVIEKYFNSENNIFKLSKFNFKKNATELIFKVNAERFDVFIDTINILGRYRKSKIIEFSVHMGLDAYKIIYAHNRNLDNEILDTEEIDEYSFIASNDHSLIVYDKKTRKLKTITPKILVNYLNDYCFVARKEDLINIEYDGTYNDDLYLIECNKFKFIPLKEQILFDITVDNPGYKYFKISNGIYVVDTVVAHALHTEEAKQEALEKMRLSKQIAHIEKYNALTSDINKNAVFGLVYGSLKPEDVNYKPKKYKLNTKIKTKEELLQQLQNIDNWSPYDIIEDKTIAQWLIDLTIEGVLTSTRKEK